MVSRDNSEDFGLRCIYLNKNVTASKSVRYIIIIVVGYMPGGSKPFWAVITARTP